MLTCRVASDITREALVPPADRSGSVLLAYIEGEVEPPDFTRTSELLDALRALGGWSAAIPELVNEGVDEYRTLGVALRLPTLPGTAESERAALDDVERFVASVETATATWPAEIAFELDGKVVGWVASGARDRLLHEGLIRPWRERLTEKGE